MSKPKRGGSPTDRGYAAADAVMDRVRDAALDTSQPREFSRAYLQHLADLCLEEIEAHGLNGDES